MIESVWFGAVAFLLVGYVVLDGFDLGAGILHFVVARTREERAQVLATIGPVWDGNEVWLVTAGATLLLAFPGLYAAAFSGFYLPLAITLWLLVFRALGIELRHHGSDPLWQDFWDTAFAASSAALALTYGVAIGNVVRGMTFDDEGRFFAPLWTDLGVADPVGLLDWYTVLVGVTAATSLALHGALFLGVRTIGGVEDRAVALSPRLAVATAALAVATTAASVVVQPRILQNLAEHPWLVVIPAAAVLGLGGVLVALRRGARGPAFAASSAYLAGMIGSAAFGIHPFVLPARAEGAGLRLADAAADAHALAIGLAWWIPGMTLVLGYTWIVYRRIARKVALDDVHH